MHDLLDENAEIRSLWAWGGRAGMAGSAIMVALFVFVAVMVGDDPETVVGWIERFPRIANARVVENATYLAVLALWMLHVAALGHRLMGACKPAGLFAIILGVVGLAIMAVGALPHIAMGPLSDLYFASDDVDRATLALIFRASWWMFDALLFTGLALVPFGTLLAGLAMRHDAGFGPGWSLAAYLLTAAGLVAAIAVLIEPGSSLAAFGVFALVFFHAGVGWRLTRIARAPA